MVSSSFALLNLHTNSSNILHIYNMHIGGQIGQTGILILIQKPGEAVITADGSVAPNQDSSIQKLILLNHSMKLLLQFFISICQNND